MALHEIQKAQTYSIEAIMTTVTQDYDRISMHGVRRTLLEMQAASIGLPLEIVHISSKASNEEYELKMAKVLSGYKELGIRTVAFGDIFLEDLRAYREEKLATVGMKGIFPIWKQDTAELSRSLSKNGFRAITTCIDTKKLGKEFVGRIIDEQFLSQLPTSVDCCGENGEYHSFVYDGPIFDKEVRFSLGEKVLRDRRYYYCDLIPN